jgi:hexosaminidase
MKKGILLMGLLVHASMAYSQASPISVIPRPASVTMLDGSFEVRPDTVIVTQVQTKALGQQLSQWLRPAMGFALRVQESHAATAGIVLAVNPDLANLGKEGYRLEVTSSRVLIESSAPAGVFYGIQTLRQLLPPEIFGAAKATGVAWRIPCVRIEDQPRFAWRGMHLDVCRHFFPKEFIKTYIDLLALHKMNVFHWHLTEDQGWRIEVKKYPKLTQVGAWRVDREEQHWNRRTPPRPGEKATYGGLYTQQDVREIVAYASSRFVTVVPEIEMPAHAMAALASYPELSCTGGPFYVMPGGYWPISDIYCAGKDSTFAFIEDVLSEMIPLFPGTYFHVGGDEAAKDKWKACPKCQARIKAEGLKDEAELQSYFIKRIETFLTSKNRRLLGWDEILEGGLAPNATVMSWRGEEGGIAAAKAGHDVVMAPNSHTYFDYYQADPKTSSEPLAIGGLLPLAKVYSYDPTPAALTPDEARHVLGVQAQIWTEYIPMPPNVEYMAYPRACALAEVAWSPVAGKDYSDFLVRLGQHLRRLDGLDVHYRPMDTK